MPAQKPKQSAIVPEKKRQTRDPQATRAKILDAAISDFAKRGLGGSRIDAIAAKAKSNKRMIYHYFGGKEILFREAIEEVYDSIRTAETKLQLDELSAIDAIKKYMTFTWDYYLKHPEFISIVNSENLHKARHMKNSERFSQMHDNFVSMLSSILDRGVKEGNFRKGIDPVQLHITMAAVGYYYLTNRHTGSIMFQKDFATKDALNERLAFNIESILRIICKTPTIVEQNLP